LEFFILDKLAKHIEIRRKCMKIKVLGAGCPKCKQLEASVRKALQEANIQAEVEKITHINEIMNYGVMMTPALVIDEKVVSVGKVLSAKKIKEIIEKKV